MHGGARYLFLAACLTAVALVACGGGGAKRDNTPAASASPTAPALDLFTDPRPRDPDEQRHLGEAPPSQFQRWDRVSTTLYDTQTGEELNLGQGTFGTFSPDGRSMTWTAGPPYDADAQQVWSIDLATKEKRLLGSPRVGLGDATPNGTSTPEGHSSTTVGSYDLDERRGEYPFDKNTFDVLDGSKVIAEFEAWMARPAGPGELVIATTPVDGSTNIFLLDIATEKLTFVASSPQSLVLNTPLAASERYVIWTDDYCAFPDKGKTRIFDRQTGKLIELDASLWVTLTPGSLIASGEFGAKALIDPDTLQYVVVIPGPASWSPDYRYASTGSAEGHGGLCG